MSCGLMPRRSYLREGVSCFFVTMCFDCVYKFCLQNYYKILTCASILAKNYQLSAFCKRNEVKYMQIKWSIGQNAVCFDVGLRLLVILQSAF